MLQNCEKTIKVIAKAFLILCLIAMVVLFLAEIADMRRELLGSIPLFIAIEVVIAITGIIGSTVLYGFGELIECAKDIRNKTKQ